MPIKILDPQTYSRIAAGEVIESPVSVLKELIENSIDAGAKNILIDIKNAGKSLIRVVDDGSGMDECDLRLSINRYATSKLSNIDDLKKLTTYGFRGEALFSIFTVSKIKITTYNGKSEHGYTLTANGGDFSTITIKPAPPLKGTSVEVMDLFYNTPVRFKFLKSDSSIKASILKLFEEFAILHYDKSLKLTIDAKERYNLKRTDSINTRIREIFDHKLLGNLVEFNENFNELQIKGFLFSNPEIKNFKNYQYIYINSRIVESKIVSQAVYKAFEDFFKTPMFIIIMDINPEKIDVNVHPQKKEVKFEDEHFIYQAIYKTVKKALENTQIPKIYKVENEKITFHLQSTPYGVSDYKPQNFFDLSKDIYTKPKWYKPPIRFIGQAFASLLIFQTSNSIIIIDQHAASERITYEKYLEELKNQNLLKQKLLIPVEIELKKSQIEKILEIKNWLYGSGFEIDQIGPNIIRIYSIPNLFDFSKNDLREILEEVTELIAKPQNLSLDFKREVIANICCKKSIKFNEVIDEQKAMSIIENLSKTKNSLHCPHGRPTLIEIEIKNLFREFERT